MAIWIYRAGRKGEHEKKFLNDGRIYLTWSGLDQSFEGVPEVEIKKMIHQAFPRISEQKVVEYFYLINPIINGIKKDDLIILPSKFSNTFHFGKVVGDYEFDSSAPEVYKHSRRVEWFATDISKDLFDNQILYDTNIRYSVGMIKNEEVAECIEYMVDHDWNQPLMNPFDDGYDMDWEAAAKSTISKYIYKTFKGYDMEDLICEILRAKGFTVYNGPKGPDGGQDLLAAAGDMGFESPKICVQVKTQNSHVKKEVVDKLSQTIEKFHAEYGLFVAWNGFDKAVNPAEYFYNIRLWTSSEVVEEVLKNYDKFSPEMQQRIPLKHVWILNDTNQK